MLRKLLFAAALLVSAPAFADTPKPSALTPYIHAETPYGEGTLTKLFLNVYDAAVWTDASEWSMDSVYALELTYRMNFEASDLVDRSIEEMDKQEPLSKENAELYKTQLARVFPNVKKGDNITALYRPQKGVMFFHNNKLTGTIADQALAKKFMGIWLSPKTSEPGLRKILVKQGG